MNDDKQQKLITRFNLTNKQRKTIGGYLFCAPFLIGFVFFFLAPFIQAVVFSVSHVEIGGGYELNFIGIDNYRYIALVHADFPRKFIETIGQTLFDLPLILSFSFFSALVLNQKFKGRTLSRVIFFLPVILSAGIVLRMEMEDYITEMMMGAEQAGFVFSGEALRNLFLQLGFPEDFAEIILEAVDRIPEIIRASGIQILIFLAGLQSIPRSIYEAADVEGATSWENFWLITLPMLSPLILTNIVYTIIDSFTAADNELVELINNSAFRGAGFGVSMGMAIIYFLAIMIILGIIVKIISGWVFYQE